MKKLLILSQLTTINQYNVTYSQHRALMQSARSFSGFPTCELLLPRYLTTIISNRATLVFIYFVLIYRYISVLNKTKFSYFTKNILLRIETINSKLFGSYDACCRKRRSRQSRKTLISVTRRIKNDRRKVDRNR